MANAIPDSGAREAALQTLIEFARGFRAQVALRSGVAGAEVIGATRRIYVELGSVGGEIAEARYDQFQPTAGTGVFLMRQRVMGLGEWLIVGQMSGDELPCI